ncbi:MAG: class III extradiol ring-cleavage dioxygenase [Limnobacter sp.]|nr:class III extradiol ring-cleavage dioxygenase [Limnobacter sp.]
MDNLNPDPIVFVSHGAPSLVLEGGPAAARLAELGQTLDGCKALVVVSPHWRSAGYEVTAGKRPGTLHDFSGFDRELYSLQYPAQGHVELAEKIASMLPGAQLNAKQPWDHGVWSPLILMRPDADIPVVQVSMPMQATPLSLFELGQQLAPLAGQGVALIGSGSLTHNLRDTRFGQTQALEYAQRFQDWVREVLQQPYDKATAALLDPNAHTPDFKLAHPYDDHYLPLLFTLGAAGLQSGAPHVYSSPIMHAALSMDSYRWSAGKPASHEYVNGGNAAQIH